MCKHLHIRIFEAHNNITHKVVYIRISFYIVQSTSCFWQSFSHFLDYFISLPLVLKSAQLISASYPWFWTCFHDFRIGFNPCPAYFSILPLVFSNCPSYFMILPLVLIKFKPMPIFYHCFPSNCTTYFRISIGLQFAIVVPHISAAYRGCSSIFSTCRIGFHQFFLPFFVSSTFTIVSLFFTFYVHPFSFCSSPVILLALSLHGLYCDMFHQFCSFVIVLFLGFIFIMFHIYSCPSPSILFQCNFA